MSRLRRPAVCAGAVAAALLVAYAALWAGVTGVEVARSDFMPNYAVANLLRDGHGAALYDASLQARAEAVATAPITTAPLPWANPPAAAVIALPLTYLPLSVAYRTWQAVQLALLLLAIVLVARAVPWPAHLRRAGVIPAVCAVAFAGVGTLSLGLLGQWDGVSALGVAGAYVFWRRDSLFAGGLVLAFTASVAKPHLALGLAALLLGWRDRRVLAGAAVGVALACLISLAAVGPAGVAGFVAALRGDATRWPMSSMLGFTGLAGSWLGEGSAAAAVAGVLSAASLGVCAWLGTRLRSDRLELDRCLAGAVALSLVAAPHMLGQDLVLLSPVVVWMLASCAAGDHNAEWPGPRTRAGLAAWAVLAAAAGVDLGATAAAPPGRIVPLALLAGAVLLLRTPGRGRLAIRPRPAS